jgi:glucose-1-phosphate adenylyltransferase
MIQNAIAVILGGGAGSRLYPLTADRSKPAVPIGGKYRIIDIPVSNCLNSNLKRMFVLTQFNSASLNKHIKKAFHFDIFTNGFVDILAAEQTPKNTDWFQGTADAVRQCIPRLGINECEYVIILSGDQLYQMDFRIILQQHIDNNCDLTVATIPVDAHDAPGFGILKVNDTNDIVDFIEKPSTDILPDWKSPVDEQNASEDKHYLASMGIYVFNKDVLLKLLADMPDSNDFGKEIIPSAVRSDDYKTGSYLFSGYWTDIGTISSYFEASISLTNFLPKFNLFDNYNPIYSTARMLSPSKIFGTRLAHTLVSDGCIIHAEDIERAVIGIRSRIGPNTLIHRSIIMGNDYYQSLTDISEASQTKLLGIGKNCVIKQTIVDKNVKIGNHVSIIGDDSLKDEETDLYSIRDGIIIIKKGVSIPDHTKIGLGS